MYAYDGEVYGKRAKGVKRCVLRDKITLGGYVGYPQEEESCSQAMRLLRSDHHHVFGQTGERTKTALSPFDSKRYILPDGVHALPYDHKDTIS